MEFHTVEAGSPLAHQDPRLVICSRKLLDCNVISYPATPRRASEATSAEEGDAASGAPQTQRQSEEETAMGPPPPLTCKAWWTPEVRPVVPGPQAPRSPAWCRGRLSLPLESVGASTRHMQAPY